MQKHCLDDDLKKLLMGLLKDNAELKKQLQNGAPAKAKEEKPKPAPAEDFDESRFERDLEAAVEASRADAGLSASSRAGSASSPTPEPARAPEAEITSVTHRKEYMALTRRMENLDAAKFPEVSALWRAGRAEPC